MFPFPLQGKKVLVPRGEKQAKSFSKAIEKYGGIPVEIPLLAFRPKEIDPILNNYLLALHTYEWVIFTSNVTVETLLSFVGNENRSFFPKIAVIGKRTEQVLLEQGLRVDFTPNEYVAEAFVDEFAPFVHKGMKVLIPKGNLARDFIAEGLRKCGAIVDEAVVYETYMPEASRTKLGKMMSKNEIDILMFTSPSTIDHFMDVMKELGLGSTVKDCLIGCIGPITEKKIKSYGLDVHASPKVYTVEEMIKSMIAYLMEDSVKGEC